jgi:hypothetical protein
MRTILALSFITLFATHANAQGLGYAVAGPATTMGFVDHSRITFNAAAGAEVIVGDMVGVGGEVGFFNRLIVGSANATVYLQRQRHGFGQTFLTGGYTLLGIGDGEGAFSAFNLGAGIMVWPGDHAGIRLEVRDHLRPDDRSTTHYWSFRAGIAIR